MEDCGWIALSRNIRRHWLWQHADKLHAWIDLLMLANFDERKLLVDNKIEIIPRGSFVTSELKLAKKWKWSRNKVRQFLSLLQSDEMIIYFGNKNGTTIRISNYEKYQIVTNLKINEKDSKKDSKKTPEGTAEGTQNNNITIYNNRGTGDLGIDSGNKFNVVLSIEEKNKLELLHGKEILAQSIEFLTHWVEEDKTGARKRQLDLKNHYHTICRWVVAAVKEKNAREKSKNTTKSQQQQRKEKFIELYKKAEQEEQQNEKIRNN